MRVLEREPASRATTRTLDRLPLTERAYHQLNHSLPLTAEIVSRVRHAAEPGDRILLIGGSSLLGSALIDAGYDVDIWQFAQAHIVDGVAERITQQVTLASLETCDVVQGEYQAIILPLLIESLPDDPSRVLRNLRRALKWDGSLIIASTNQSRLQTRLAAFFGRRFSMRRSAPPLSLSWPAFPTVHEYHRDDLLEFARGAGFRVRACDYVNANRSFMEMEPLPIESYLLKKSADVVERLVPSTREAMILVLAPRQPVDARPVTGEDVTVSVIVSARSGGTKLVALLQALASQTFSRERFNVIVVHAGASPDIAAAVDDARHNGLDIDELVHATAEGPAARNAAIARATGTIVAHTDDSCELPLDWIETATSRFEDDVAIVSGPIFAGPDSRPKFLDLPGLRPDPAERERWREDLFQISNVFHRRDVVLAADGFSERFATGMTGAASGWDTELAWRVVRGGWQARFREEVRATRQFPQPARRGLAEQTRLAAELPRLYAEVPELARGRLSAGVFASRQTMYFDLMLAGLALAGLRRHWLPALLAWPWMTYISKRISFFPPWEWHHSAITVARMGALHFAWLRGFVIGSIKSRRPVL
jgi:hypothetical protein